MGERASGSPAPGGAGAPQPARAVRPVASIAVDLVIEDAGWREIDALGLIEDGIARAASRIGLAGGGYEVTVALCDDQTVRALNAQFRGKDKATNVLSFPALRPPALAGQARQSLGDIVLARETVVREAAGAEISAADHACHLAVHGFLHLAGHDHESDAEAEAMEALESEILTGMGLADPYSDAAGSEVTRQKVRTARP